MYTHNTVVHACWRQLQIIEQISLTVLHDAPVYSSQLDLLPGDSCLGGGSQSSSRSCPFC